MIPVGITSGRVVALPPGSEGAVVIDENASSSRRRRRGERGNASGNGSNNGDLNQLLGHMGMGIGMGGPDLEEVSGVTWSASLIYVTNLFFPIA